MLKLTEKQEAYAQLLAQDMDLVDAYKRAYNVTTSNESSIKAMAYRTAKNKKVAQRVGELREKAHLQRVEATLGDDGITRDWIMGRLKSEAEDKKNSGAVRVRAVELIAKAEGVFDDDASVQASASTAREMEQKILKRLERLLPQAHSNLPQA